MLPEPRYTAHKAHYAGVVSAVGTIASYAAARALGFEPPSMELVEEAIRVLGAAAAMGAATWAAAYFKSNKEK